MAHRAHMIVMDMLYPCSSIETIFRPSIAITVVTHCLILNKWVTLQTGTIIAGFRASETAEQRETRLTEDWHSVSIVRTCWMYSTCMSYNKGYNRESFTWTRHCIFLKVVSLKLAVNHIQLHYYVFYVSHLSRNNISVDNCPSNYVQQKNLC